MLSFTTLSGIYSDSLRNPGKPEHHHESHRESGSSSRNVPLTTGWESVTDAKEQKTAASTRSAVRRTAEHQRPSQEKIKRNITTERIKAHWIKLDFDTYLTHNPPSARQASTVQIRDVAMPTEKLLSRSTLTRAIVRLSRSSSELNNLWLQGVIWLINTIYVCMCVFFTFRCAIVRNRTRISSTK